MSLEAYGLAYMSPVFVENLISPRKYNPIRLLSDAPGMVKTTVERQRKQSKKLPVIIAGNLDILHTYLRCYPDQECKVILCDMPPALNPCVGPFIRWLDCDQQQGGAWQVAKLMIEDLEDQLDLLNPLTAAGRQALLGVKRLQSDDRLEHLKKFAETMPKYYSELIASLDKEQNKSPLKTIKEARKTKETLRSLLTATLETVDERHREDLARLVLDYVLALIGKREYLSKINSVVQDETVKKDFLTLRKWMDAKSGVLLQASYLDLVANADRRSWVTILETTKKVAEADLIMLMAHYDIKKAKAAFCDKLGPYLSLPGDKVAPKLSNLPAVSSLGDYLNF